jgi:ABC-2 type transport system ATP-binding protein
MSRIASLFLGALLAALAAGCGKSPSVSVSSGDPDPVDPSTPTTAVCDAALASMPASPAGGDSRTGLICEINIPSPLDPTQKIAFQVFEPLTLVGGQRYPLVLEGHGFSGSRQTDANGPGIPGLSTPVGALRAAGYGIVSIDQAGHGETGGTIRVMDPDQEGLFLIAILDWLETHLDWYAVGPDLDAGEDNMLLGAVGPSYGGGYQYLIHAIDPKKRLDALVPQITWNDLTYSLNPGDVIKALWDSILFGIGQTAGGGGNFDPFVNSTFAAAFLANRFDPHGNDFFRYHGLGYFCGGTPIATNGGPGTTPDFAPIAPTGVHVLAFQGFRDTLFNFNEAWRNYECLNDAGGDVRLLTYQGGHNSLQVVPDPVALVTQPQGALDFSCGDINSDVATVAWFDQYLKGVPGAADAVLHGAEVCYSLSPGDAVFTDHVISGTGGTAFSVPATPTVAGVALLAVPIPMYTAPAGGSVLAGVPRVEITLAEAIPGLIADPDDVIVFVGTGRTRAGLWELADNQVQPLRGLGTHAIDLPGIGERLAAGDQAGLLLYGLHEQFVVTGGLNVPSPVIGTVSMSGTAWLPLLPTIP